MRGNKLTLTRYGEVFLTTLSLDGRGDVVESCTALKSCYKPKTFKCPFLESEIKKNCCNPYKLRDVLPEYVLFYLLQQEFEELREFCMDEVKREEASYRDEYGAFVMEYNTEITLYRE